MRRQVGLPFHTRALPSDPASLRETVEQATDRSHSCRAYDHFLQKTTCSRGVHMPPFVCKSMVG